jgi:hypothetical protein
VGSVPVDADVGCVEDARTGPEPGEEEEESEEEAEEEEQEEEEPG